MVRLNADRDGLANADDVANDALRHHFLVDAGLFVGIDVARAEARLEHRVNLVEGFRHEALDFRLAVDDESEGGRLYSANGAQLPVVESVGAREVETHEPVGVSACPGRLGQRVKISRGFESLEALTDGVIRERADPEPPTGLFRPGKLVDEPKDMPTGLVKKLRRWTEKGYSRRPAHRRKRSLQFTVNISLRFREGNQIQLSLSLTPTARRICLEGCQQVLTLQWISSSLPPPLNKPKGLSLLTLKAFCSTGMALASIPVHVRRNLPTEKPSIHSPVFPGGVPLRKSQGSVTTLIRPRSPWAAERAMADGQRGMMLIQLSGLPG